MTPTRPLPEHGTYARYRAGCHEPCCRRANTLHQNLFRMGRTDRLVDGTGARRRAQALRRLRWRNVDIATAGGVHERLVKQLLLPTRTTAPVRASTAAAVTRAYDRLSMSWGPAIRLDRSAVDWPPPLAWDDDTIDDPTAAPAHQLQTTVLCGRPRPGPVVHADEVEFLADHGLTRAAIADRLGVQFGSLQPALERAGRRDLWVRLCLREHAHVQQPGRAVA